MNDNNKKSYKERLLGEKHIFREIDDFVRGRVSEELAYAIYLHTNECDICAEYLTWETHLAASEEVENTAHFRFGVCKSASANTIRYYLKDLSAAVPGSFYIYHEDRELEKVFFHAVRFVKGRRIDLVQISENDPCEIRISGPAILNVLCSVESADPEQVQVDSAHNGIRIPNVDPTKHLEFTLEEEDSCSFIEIEPVKV
jgi:hypothetical protein